MCRHLSWLLVPLLAACIDFVDVTEPTRDASGSMLRVSVEVHPHGPSGNTISVNGELYLGMDAQGQRLQLASDTLWIMGVPLRPVAGGYPHVLDYRGVLPASGRQLNMGATVLPPPLHGVAAHPEIRWYAPGRADPDTIFLRRGGDLHLRLVVPPTSTKWESWSFNLDSQEGQVSSFRAGPLPATISVPATFVPHASGGLLRAAVNHNAFWGDDVARTSPPPNGAYIVEVNVRTRMQWIVRVIDP